MENKVGRLAELVGEGVGAEPATRVFDPTAVLSIVGLDVLFGGGKDTWKVLASPVVRSV